MLRVILTAAVALSLPLDTAYAQSACLTTTPLSPPFVPPTPYLQTANSGGFWFGTEALWTGLPVDGKWGGLHEAGLRQKLLFWAKGYDWRKEPNPELILTGRRIDGDAPDIAVARANNAFVPSKDAAGMMIGFEIPRAGCWELTAHYHGHALTFVILVQR